MSRPADGLLAAVAAVFGPDDIPDDAARAAADWLAQHLDALAEGSPPDEFDRNAIRGWRAAAAEVRAAGGVE